MIGLYTGVLGKLQAKIDVKAEQMTVGVAKLEETNGIVKSLQDDLKKLEPVLKEKAEETDKLLEQVAVDQAAADVVKEKVSAEAAVVGKQAEEVAAVQAEAQAALDVALPALRSAISALNSLSKDDISIVKSFPKPPVAVQIVMEAICIMLEAKPDWDSAKKLLNESAFLDRLRNYDKDNIAPSILSKIRKSTFHERSSRLRTSLKFRAQQRGDVHVGACNGCVRICCQRS